MHLSALFQATTTGRTGNRESKKSIDFLHYRAESQLSDTFETIQYFEHQTSVCVCAKSEEWMIGWIDMRRKRRMVGYIEERTWIYLAAL